jgi:hypothetical protein
MLDSNIDVQEKYLFHLSQLSVDIEDLDEIVDSSFPGALTYLPPIRHQVVLKPNCVPPVFLDFYL